MIDALLFVGIVVLIAVGIFYIIAKYESSIVELKKKLRRAEAYIENKQTQQEIEDDYWNSYFRPTNSLEKKED